MLLPRPVPVVGDRTSAAQRAAAPAAWAFETSERSAFYEVISARRDVRRFRPDPVPDEVLQRVLAAGHAAPSVGHSQPWRFLVVDDAQVRDRAAVMADRERLAQAAVLDPESGRQLLDLQLEGLREAPLGVVVCCDRRTPAAGVLGRSTFPDADLWSCACAIENMWLAARAEGLGLGWVTLFQPAELEALLGLPPGVVTLGWLCLGWPDERPPSPGLERAGWSRRRPVAEVVLRNRWPVDAEPTAPMSRLSAPAPADVVAARDEADVLFSVPGSLGVLDRALDRVAALRQARMSAATLVLVVGRHRVTDLGVSPYATEVGEHVLTAAQAGAALGVVAAEAAGIAVEVHDAGTASGNLRDSDALSRSEVRRLLERGSEVGKRCAGSGALVLGEIGIGNTTVAAALAASLLGLPAVEVVGLGAGADADMLSRKTEVVSAALLRWDSACRRRQPPARWLTGWRSWQDRSSRSLPASFSAVPAPAR